MSEAVDQAAPDWQGRAEREAAALLDGLDVSYVWDREVLVQMLAIAWLQGVNLGCHETLAMAEGAFDRMRAAL